MLRITSQEISPPFLDHSHVYQKGVTFNEIEEKCPKAYPLTLTRDVKTPAEGEEVKRARKIKNGRNKTAEGSNP